MAFDEELDARISEIIAALGAERKKMFGGTGYMLDGNMVVGDKTSSGVVRLGEEAGDEALGRPHTRPFDVTGRPMKGWVMVDPGGFEGDELEAWIERATSFVQTLPPK